MLLPSSLPGASPVATNPRGVEERLQWFLSHDPGGVGMCARHCWQALGGSYGNPPRWGARNANEVYDKVVASGRFFRTEPPIGALVLWKYGENGHAALAALPGRIATTDPTDNPGGTGIEPITYPQKWGARSYIWTDEYNGVRFPVKEPPVADPYIVKKADTNQTLPLNRWVQLDLGAVDAIQPPLGANDWDSYLNLDFTTLKGAARNDLRYVLGRWARHDATSNDLTSMAGGKYDVTGADTKAIPPDLPKGMIRFTWSHGFKGEAGVPVSFWVYIGSMKDGSIVSPLRIFKVDDES